MRALARALGPALVLFLMAPVANAEVFVGADGGQAAEADWIKWKNPREGTWFIALVYRSGGTSGIGSEAYVGRGTCTRQRGKHFTITFCSATVRGRELAIDELEFDPALGSAEVTFRQGRYRQHVVWTAKRPAGPSVGAYEGIGVVFVDAGLVADAKAAATLFGVRLRPSDQDSPFSYLYEGASALVFVYGPDGTIRIHRTWRVPA